MLRLGLMLFAIIGTTLMGMGVVAVLTLRMDSTAMPIIIAAAVGFLLAIPASWLVAQQILAVKR